MVDHPSWLEEACGRLEVFSLEVDGPVLQLGQALAGKVGIDWSGEHEKFVFGKLRFHLEIVHTQPHGDVLVVEQHLLEHCSVAIAGQSLQKY